MTQNDTKDTGSLGNTKPNSRSRKWVFTINNYTDNTIDNLKNMFKDAKYIMGKEGDTKTQHIQGYVEYKNARTFTSIKKIMPRAHIEKAKGSTKQNYTYCSKEGDYTTNIDLRTFKQKIKEQCLESYKNIVWKDWQKKVLFKIEQEPDTRTITWIWDTKGNIGKSFLCKYIALKHDIIICEGKHTDIFNQVNTLMEAEKLPKIIICDIPRTSIGYVSYTALEKLKNGMIYSGKYEGGVCIFPPPHVICFANTAPDTRALSEDRWEIIDLTPL